MLTTLYSQKSRYYDVDTEYDLPQDNMLKSNYEYDTTVVLDRESGRLDLVSYRVYNTPVNLLVVGTSSPFPPFICPKFVLLAYDITSIEAAGGNSEIS